MVCDERKKLTKRKKQWLVILVLILWCVFSFTRYERINKLCHAICENDKEEVEAILEGSTKGEINSPPCGRGYMAAAFLILIDADGTLYPLQEACMHSDIEMVELLIEHGADVTVRDTYTNGSVINDALEYGREDRYKMANVLIKYGADIDAVDKYGKTPLSLIFESDLDESEERRLERRELFCYLMENCKTIKVESCYDYNNLLEAASRCDDVFEVQYLIENGYFDVDTVSEEGTTALHIAARAGSIDVCRYLLESGADKTIKDKEGKTAYDYVLEEIADEEKRQYSEEIIAINQELEELLR